MKDGCSVRGKERSSWYELSPSNTWKSLGSIRFSESGSWILLWAWRGSEREGMNSMHVCSVYACELGGGGGGGGVRRREGA